MTSSSEVLANFYGAQFEIDQDEVARREEQVRELKRTMGDTYLLARHVKRKRQTKRVRHG